jgi:hypothetical protein
LPLSHSFVPTNNLEGVIREENMKNNIGKLEKLYIRFGKSVFGFDKNILLQKISNGYIVGNEYRETFDEAMDLLKEELNKHFKE